MVERDHTAACLSATVTLVALTRLDLIECYFCFFPSYSFLRHCHTKLGALNLADRRVLFVFCGHRVTSYRQLFDILRRLQGRRKLAVRFILPTKLADYSHRHIRVRNRRVHKRVRHHTSHDVISSVSISIKFVSVTGFMVNPHQKRTIRQL